MILLLRTYTGILFLLCWTSVSAQPPLRAINPADYYAALLGGEWCEEPDPGASLFDQYFQGYQDFLRTALHGSEQDFKEYFERTDQRLSSLDESTALHAYIEAELTLQAAFIELKAGNELSSAWKLRQAYKLTEAGIREYPDYDPLRKTLGVMQCLIGAIPENMQWLPGLFGIRGTLEEGLKNMRTACEEEPWLCRETRYLMALSYSYLLSDNEQAIALGEEALGGGSPSPLPVYLLMNIYLRAHNAQKALALFNRLEPATCGNIPQLHYLQGNALLQKGEYAAARNAYRSFLGARESGDFVKDAWYKSGLAWWLEGNRTEAQKAFEKTLSAGSDETEADRYAHKHAARSLPDPQILRIRLLTDGGYYIRAESLLQNINPQDFEGRAEQTEIVYRTARLAHLTKDTVRAIAAYKNTLVLQADRSLYFAPNACLQLGYLLTPSNPDLARYWFEKVKEYRGYEYEKGIERKAQAALNQLR